MPLVALSDSRAPGLPPGAYDVRGWPVRTLVDDEKAGEVHDLLLDGQGEPRYLDVDLGPFRKHVLLPIGQARADHARRRIWVPGFTREQFRDIPPYDHDLTDLGRRYERGLLAAYTSAYAGLRHRERPPYAGTVYGPSELETRVRRTAPRLAPLGSLPDYRIADGEPDPRGWQVLASDGTRIGRMDELLVDTAALKVRFLVCRVDEAALDLERLERRILIPVGFARLDEASGSVLVDALSVDAVARMPVYTGARLSRELEAELAEAYTDEPDDRAFYDRPHFSPRDFFGPPAA